MLGLRGSGQPLPLPARAAGPLWAGQGPGHPCGGIAFPLQDEQARGRPIRNGAAAMAGQPPPRAAWRGLCSSAPSQAQGRLGLWSRCLQSSASSPCESRRQEGPGHPPSRARCFEGGISTPAIRGFRHKRGRVTDFGNMSRLQVPSGGSGHGPWPRAAAGGAPGGSGGGLRPWVWCREAARTHGWFWVCAWRDRVTVQLLKWVAVPRQGLGAQELLLRGCVCLFCLVLSAGHSPGHGDTRTCHSSCPRALAPG